MNNIEEFFKGIVLGCLIAIILFITTLVDHLGIQTKDMCELNLKRTQSCVLTWVVEKEKE